mmetsp:Transcript_696/g.2076  ORF Transcript_696/g.2076 Transcript_696/m.2076 type:complete len:120 (-) Transcript_696:191-550(-)|eukprot:CAMPEP_0113526704 /NCGR_PEP_ID=MMETSP0015_2-20120614/893_1 /TAXON_ID=2838 /ORGANISM="Odontella" /LENGTH=119 /DNA_ID=CAMNT_0000425067 /DNA_START=38 /DNA_END=397 /DNA_ORIENTATION=- /assembly_acc=CAM_ASM_000160
MTKSTTKKENTKARAGKARRKTKNKGANSLSFKRYIHKVLKQVHPDMTIGQNAMQVMEDMTIDMFHRIATASKDCRKRPTLLQYEVQSAVKLTLAGTGDLMKHSISEATKAVGKYEASV